MQLMRRIASTIGPIFLVVFDRKLTMELPASSKSRTAMKTAVSDIFSGRVANLISFRVSYHVLLDFALALAPLVRFFAYLAYTISTTSTLCYNITSGIASQDHSTALRIAHKQLEHYKCCTIQSALMNESASHHRIS